jgi:DNA-binding LytR/AlgR family response regulator
VNTKLKCILLDDEIPGLTYLKMLCEQIPALEVIKAFNSPNKFLSDIDNIDFDLCILDIEMPEINGLQLATLLKGKLLIFTTAYKEYAAEAFDVDAIDYVRKPVRKERLEQAVQKAITRHKSKTPAKEFVQLNTDKGKTLLHFKDVAYIKASDTDSRDKIAILLDGSSLILKNITFENLASLLPASQFCRISKREMISRTIIHTYSYNEITTFLNVLPNQPLKITLSEVYRPQFLKFANPNL